MLVPGATTFGLIPSVNNPRTNGKPLHSWESDYADAFRMFVVAMDGGARTLNYTQGDLDYSARDRMVV